MDKEPSPQSKFEECWRQLSPAEQTLCTFISHQFQPFGVTEQELRGNGFPLSLIHHAIDASEQAERELAFSRVIEKLTEQDLLEQGTRKQFAQEFLDRTHDSAAQTAEMIEREDIDGPSDMDSFFLYQKTLEAKRLVEDADSGQTAWRMDEDFQLFVIYKGRGQRVYNPYLPTSGRN